MRDQGEPYFSGISDIHAENKIFRIYYISED